MNYTQAMAAVTAGQQAWRKVWPATTYVTANNELVTATGRKPFPPSADDKSATDWVAGKRP
jgi:hypothetical protein